MRVPDSFKSKQQIGAECPKKNLFYSLVSVSIAIMVPPEVKITEFSPSCLDHLRLRHFSA